MNRPVPEADPVAYARQKYELENRRKRSLLGKAVQPFVSKPDILNAAKSGSPRMETLKPYTPVSIPAAAKGGEAAGNTGVGAGGGGSDVTVSTVNESKLIDSAPDARQNPGTAQAPAAKTGGAVEKPAADLTKGPVPDASLPQNHTGKMSAKDMAKLMKKHEELTKKKQQQTAKAQKKAQEDQARKNKNKKETTAPAATQPQPQPADAGGSTIKQ
jgi:hypothetical protein